MAGNFPLSVTLSIVDKATAPIRAFSKKINDGFKPLRDMKNRLKLTASDLGLPKIGKAFSGIGKATGGVIKQVKALGKEFAIVGGLAAGVMSGVVYTTANAGDAAYKSAQKVGMATESWSKLAYAADMSGVSTEQLQAGLTKLNGQVVNVARGNKESAFWFRALGVELKDQTGKIKSNDVLLGDLAERFAAMPEGMKKTTLAAKIFGDSLGPELIPFLNAGRAGIEELGAEAGRLGQVFTDEQGKASESFNDSLSRVGKAIKGVSNAIGNQLIPKLEPLLNWIEEIIVANRDLVVGKVQEWLARIDKALPSIEERLVAFWTQIESAIVWINELVESLGGWGTVLPPLVAALALVKLAPLIVSVIVLTKAVIALGVALLTTPIGWITLAIAALVAGFIYLWRNCEGFRKFWIEMWNRVVGYFQDVMQRVEAAFEEGFIQAIVTALVEFNPVTLFIAAFSSVLEYFTGFSLVEAGNGIITSLWDGMHGAWTTVTGWLEKSISDGSEAVAGYLTPVFARIQAAFDVGLLDGLDAILREFNPLLFFANALNAVVEYLTGFSLFDAGEKLINSLWEGLEDTWGKVTGWLHESIAELTGWMPDWVKDKLGLNIEIPKVAVQSVEKVSPKNMAPPVGVQASMRQDAVNRYSVRDARATLEIMGAPGNSRVSAKGFSQTRVQYDDSAYYGLRMGGS